MKIVVKLIYFRQKSGSDSETYSESESESESEKNQSLVQSPIQSQSDNIRAKFDLKKL